MRKHKAQSILEYSVIIACIIAGLVAMTIYIKRGIQGRFRQVSDSIGEQYSPKNTESDLTTSVTSEITSQVYRLPAIPAGCSAEDVRQGKEGCAPEAWIAYREERIDKEETIREGYEEVGKLENDLFSR